MKSLAAPCTSEQDLDTAEFNIGNLADKPGTGSSFDTHFWVGEVAKVDVVKVETDRKTKPAHTEITGTGSWKKKRNENGMNIILVKK